MRITLDEMLRTLRGSLEQMSTIVDEMVMTTFGNAAWGQRAEIAEQQADIDALATGIDTTIIDLLAMQQPIVATDLSIVRGILLISRHLGYIAHEQMEINRLIADVPHSTAFAMQMSGFADDIRGALRTSIAVFLTDDRLSADLLRDRMRHLHAELDTLELPDNQGSLIAQERIQVLELKRILDATNVIVSATPIYRYAGVTQ